MGWSIVSEELANSSRSFRRRSAAAIRYQGTADAVYQTLLDMRGTRSTCGALERPRLQYGLARCAGYQERKAAGTWRRSRFRLRAPLGIIVVDETSSSPFRKTQHTRPDSRHADFALAVDGRSISSPPTCCPCPQSGRDQRPPLFVKHHPALIHHCLSLVPVYDESKRPRNTARHRHVDAPRFNIDLPVTRVQPVLSRWPLRTDQPQAPPANSFAEAAAAAAMRSIGDLARCIVSHTITGACVPNVRVHFSQ